MVPSEEKFLAFVAKSLFHRLTNAKFDAKMVKTQNEYVKNLKKVDEYVAHLKSLNHQTGWYFSVPLTNTRKAGVTEKYNVEDHEFPEYTLKSLPALPKMCNWAPVNKNVNAPEEKILHHVPYIEDSVVSDIEWQNHLLDLYEDNVHMPAEDFLTDVILADLVDELTSQAWGKGSLTLHKTIVAPARPIIVDKELAFELICCYVVNFAYSPEELKEKYHDYQLVKNKKALYLETIPNIDGKQDSVYTREKALHSFQTLLCSQCFLYDCLSHYFVKPIYKPQEENFPGCTKPCGENCFLKKKPDELQGGHLTCSEKTLFNVLVVTFQRNFCVIARTLGTKSCADVYVHFQRLPDIEKQAIRRALSEGKKWTKAKPRSCITRGKTMLTKWRAKKRKADEIDDSCADGSGNHHEQQQQQQQHHHHHQQPGLSGYKPCDHPGLPCSAEEAQCSCMSKGIFCEKFCNCLRSCGNRFVGCKCKGSCTSGKCPCQSAARECDPDLCKTCGAAELDRTSEKFKCANVAIQRGLRKHLLLGRSAVSGWGVFLGGQVAAKDELIAEYCGETINQEEAERRGRVYDKGKASYLFNLNGDNVVDAKRKGNKIRFANHSALNANCTQKVKLVNGDHRIGIYASRPIARGEELFFDYRYDANERLTFVAIELDEKQSSTESRG